MPLIDAALTNIGEAYPNLESLALRGFVCSSEYYLHLLAGLPHLRSLELSHVKLGVFSAIASTCPLLTSLTLLETVGDGLDEGLVNIARAHPLLEQLNFVGERDFISNYAFEELVKYCPRIKRLSFDEGFDGKEVFTKLKGLPLLEYLCINKADLHRIAPSDLLALSFPSLKCLCLREVTILDSCLEALLCASPRLEIISLDFCDDLTPECLKYFRAMPNLTLVSIKGCFNVQEGHLVQLHSMSRAIIDIPACDDFRICTYKF